jgi:alkanesulfonate monooxygenase SsuD/methylene tetrahydromethanopterin reductase-like flavin-dependent oxidoreductase (luciferase family)
LASRSAIGRLSTLVDQGDNPMPKRTDTEASDVARLLEQSKIKSIIVAEHFFSWAKVVTGSLKCRRD